MGYNTIPSNPWPLPSDQAGGSGEAYTLPIASADTLGGVKVGTGLSINAETGALSNSNPTPYSLPTAAADTLGGVKVGTRLSIADGVLSADSQLVDYSTDEVDTGVKWIDGKTIYRKVYDVDLLPDSTTKEVSSGLTNITPIKISGITYGTDEPTSVPVVAWSTSPVLCYFGYNTVSNKIIIISNSNFGTAGMKAYVVLEYTKTPTE